MVGRGLHCASCCALAAALLLAPMQPARAEPYTLEQLLAMPIEQLLTIPCKTLRGPR
jgi:hypothetical protein